MECHRMLDANPLALRAAGTFVVMVAGAALAPIGAQEYCVGCSGPNALYRCVLEKAVPTGIPLTAICTATLARQGGHTQCSVKAGTIFDCDAPIRKIDVRAAADEISRPKPNHPIATSPATTTPPVPAPAENATPYKHPGMKPDELASKQAEQVNDPAKKSPPAGSLERMTTSLSRATRDTSEAIKGTTRKTWDCISSLFKTC